MLSHLLPTFSRKTVHVIDFYVSMFFFSLQNEPEDLTGNRRGSNHHEENNDGLQ